jgi:hypothetical protein
MGGWAVGCGVGPGLRQRAHREEEPPRVQGPGFRRPGRVGKPCGAADTSSSRDSRGEEVSPVPGTAGAHYRFPWAVMEDVRSCPSPPARRR